MIDLNTKACSVSLKLTDHSVNDKWNTEERFNFLFYKTFFTAACRKGGVCSVYAMKSD